MRCIACVSSENIIFDSKNITNFLNNCTNIPNATTKFFNKINSVLLDESDYSKKIECLEAMKKVPLYVKYMKISSNNTEELENLTDPNLYSTPISNLILELKGFNISSKTIENLKAIRPNSIRLIVLWSGGETENQVFFGNFSKLLSNLDQTTLEMNFLNEDYRAKLEFSDVILKILESNEECSYVKAKSVKIPCKDEEFCWIKSRDLNMRVIDSYYFCLNKLRHVNISEFIMIKDQEEIKEVEKMFDNESLSEINKGIITPMKYFNRIYITIIE